MFWCYGLLSFLLLFGNTYGDVSERRVRRQNAPVQNGQLIDNIFNIPITAIRQSAAAAQVISPENTETIDNIIKIPVSTLEAVGTLVKTATEQRRLNAENIRNARQERRERLAAIKEQKRKRKEEIQNQRLQQQLTRVVRHHKDSFGLNAWSDFLIGHHGFFDGHQTGGHLGNRHKPGGIHKPHEGHGGHGHGSHGHGGHGGHGGHEGNQPNQTYAVHENVNEDTSFSWHGLTAGFGTLYGTRPSNTDVIIENKIAPKQRKQKVFKYQSNYEHSDDAIAKIKNKPGREYDEPPLENKIAPRSAKVKFVR
nr:PREDICTED: uncharacterized protein LOC105677858 [Linepithema humile]